MLWCRFMCFDLMCRIYCPQKSAITSIWPKFLDLPLCPYRKWLSFPELWNQNYLRGVDVIAHLEYLHVLLSRFLSDHFRVACLRFCALLTVIFVSCCKASTTIGAHFCSEKGNASSAYFTSYFDISLLTFRKNDQSARFFDDLNAFQA